MAMKSIFDRYVWQARIWPALIGLVRIGLAIVTWLPEAKTIFATMVSMIMIPALLLIADLAEGIGSKLDGRLFGENGWPTTQRLRHLDRELNQYTKQRYYHRLRDLVPATALPTLKDEEADPKDADLKYAS